MSVSASIGDVVEVIDGKNVLVGKTLTIDCPPVGVRVVLVVLDVDFGCLMTNRMDDKMRGGIIVVTS